MKKRKLDFPLQLIIPAFLILLAIFLSIRYIYRVLTTSDFFNVKKVIVRNFDSKFDYLQGRNIFGLDLKMQSRRAFLHCPDCRKIRFSRILPDTIVIDFVKRQPVALVKFYKNFCVDEDGFFFFPAGSYLETQLPIICGLETKIFAPKPGVKYRRPELDLALSIIKEIKENRSFKGFTLTRIDALNPESTGFFLLMPKQLFVNPANDGQPQEAGFEIRIGQGNIKQKLVILSGLIMQARKDWGNIKYIDLRFKEPLIKLNDVK